MKEQLSHRERRLKDEWDISYILARKIDEAISTAEKYVRAQVLASVKAVLAPLLDRLQQLLGDEDLDEEKLQDASEGLLPELHDAILKLSKVQPAASDLEALLREAEVKGMRWAEGRDVAQITARLNELEKARAEGKG